MSEGRYSERAKRLRDRLDALVVCISHSWGGLEQVAASDAVELAGLGLKIRVLCLEGTPIHENLAHREDLEIVPLSFRPRNYFDFKLRNQLRRLISTGVNLVHTHQTTLLGSLSPWLWNYPRIPLIATRHIMNSHDKRDFFHRLIYRRVDSLVVMSRALQRNVLETHPVKAADVKVINLGLDFDRFDPTKVDKRAFFPAWGVGPDTLVIGMVGRIDPAKGQSTFIKAAAGVIKNAQEGERFKFIIVGEETLGSSDQHLEELRKMVAQFGLQEHVVFAGYEEDIPSVMRGFDIFVMPSRQEAFGLVAIEAMAMECPIVISGGGSAEEIVGNDEYGLTIRPDDAFDLQRQLRRLIDQPAERLEMGRRARQHVTQSYDRVLRMSKTLELYENVLLKRKAIGVF